MPAKLGQATRDFALSEIEQPKFHQAFEKDGTMNWDTVKGQWKQFRGNVKEQWGKLTDDDLDRIEGKRDQLVGAIQERYGIARDEAEQQLAQFESSQK